MARRRLPRLCRIRLLTSKGALDVAAAQHGTATERNASIFAKSFLTAVTNPKGYLFFSAFLPQFLDPSAPLAPQYVALAVTFALLDGVVMFGYALLGARAVRLLKRAGALWLERTCGAMLLALAGSLALYRRHAA